MLFAGPQAQFARPLPTARAILPPPAPRTDGLGEAHIDDRVAIAVVRLRPFHACHSLGAAHLLGVPIDYELPDREAARTLRLPTVVSGHRSHHAHAKCRRTIH